MHRDRLSELPLPLIHHILSFLPIGDVVSTTILSKHWVDLWTTVPCITIHGDYEGKSLGKLVNGALRRWKGTTIQKFIIDTYGCDGYFDDDDFHAWMDFAFKNKVVELDIWTAVDSSLPQDLYSCSSITRLVLNSAIELHGTPSWNQLKSLTLVTYDNGIEDLVNQIMLGSPMLEVFELNLDEVHDFWNLNIISRSLKRLKIDSCCYFEDGTCFDTLSICCPNLDTLEINGLFTCLFTDVSSLTDVTFGFNKWKSECDCGQWIELLGDSLKQIFPAMQNVEKLALSELFVQVFGASHTKYFSSPLPNVKFLKLVVREYRIEFGDVLDLLGIFPNLKYVKIEGMAFRKPPVSNTVNNTKFVTNISMSILLQLKIVEITARSFDSSVFKFIEYLLKHGIMLEKLVIWSKGITLVEHKRFSEKLLSMPRSSPTARVIIKSN